MNGDGITDIMNANWIGTSTTYIDNSNKIDSLTQIANDKGAVSTITYKPSTNYISGGNLLNPNSPFVFETVSQISTNDGFATTSSNQYIYAGGRFYFNGAFDRKFAGFNKIKSSTSIYILI